MHRRPVRDRRRGPRAAGAQRHRACARTASLALEGRDGILERIVFAAGEPLPRRALFFTTGQSQQSELAIHLGCEFNEKGTVRTGKYETTHLPGLFVAGDASRAVQWVVVAAAEGAEAAFAINTDLLQGRPPDWTALVGIGTASGPIGLPPRRVVHGPIGPSQLDHSIIGFALVSTAIGDWSGLRGGSR